MFVIIGIVIVIGAILGGYLMEHGNIRVLLQPAELVIIAGASLGTVLIANPLHILKKIIGGLAGVFGGSKYVFQGAQGRADGAGNGQRQSGAKPGVFEVSKILEGSPRAAVCVRHDPHGGGRGD
jgi:predicted MFS family arabinose efflux permease